MSPWSIGASAAMSISRADSASSIDMKHESVIDRFENFFLREEFRFSTCVVTSELKVSMKDSIWLCLMARFFTVPSIATRQFQWKMELIPEKKALSMSVGLKLMLTSLLFLRWRS